MEIFPKSESAETGINMNWGTNLEFFKKIQKQSYLLLTILLIFIGVFLRTKLYITNNVFSDDECRLLLSLADKNLLQSCLFLGSAQSAPPVFVFCTKLVTYVFGFREYVVKFIPFISSILSVYFFFKCCTLYLKNRYAQLIALFIFSICQPLIAFSSIFKQYSTDVLLACICLYYLPQIQIKDLSRKKLAFLSLILCVLPLISLPALFFIGAFWIKNISFNLKDKNFWYRFTIQFLPFLTVTCIYWFFNLAPAKVDLYNYFPNYWDDGFFNLSFSDFIRFLVLNIKFYFVPNTFTLPAVILLFWGIYQMFKEKSEYILSTVFLVLLASLMHIYPLSGRVGLYFIPVIILLILKPLDSKNKFLQITALLLIILSFGRYNLNYYKNIIRLDYFVSCSPEKPLRIIKEQFNPSKDIILCNSASTPSYLFYSNKIGFAADNIYEIPVTSADEKTIFQYLEGLKNNQGYWFYLIKDYNNFKLYPSIFKWLKNQNVKYSFNERNSYLFYVEK